MAQACIAHAVAITISTSGQRQLVRVKIHMTGLIIVGLRIQNRIAGRFPARFNLSPAPPKSQGGG
jgi:hypothetical protein